MAENLGPGPLKINKPFEAANTGAGGGAATTTEAPLTPPPPPPPIERAASPPRPADFGKGNVDGRPGVALPVDKK